MIILPGCTCTEGEVKITEQETEAAPVDVDYEVKSEDTLDNTEAYHS